MLKRIALLVVLLLAMGTTAQEGPALSGAEGIRNFLRVNEKICTGGQPTLAQLAELKAGGLRAVLNLRRPTEKQTPRPGAGPVPYDAAAEAAEAGRLGLRYFNIAVDPDVPTDAQVDEFLKILADRENRPIFIHCGAARPPPPPVGPARRRAALGVPPRGGGDGFPLLPPAPGDPPRSLRRG